MVTSAPPTSDTFMDLWVYVTIKANVRDMVRILETASTSHNRTKYYININTIVMSRIFAYMYYTCIELIL